ncbi:MAG: QueT transporter family protein [Nitrososphaerota archaeon]|nr:QueT transporter family protein [Nitrososphaerota archaeon]
MRRSIIVATAAVYAAMYVVLAVGFAPISYGVINLRVANILLGLVPLIGWPAILGQALGVFIANQPALGDTLGPIDLVNVVPTLVFAWVLWKIRRRSVFLGLTLYSIALGVSVSLALSYVFNLPLLVEIPQVTAGIFLVTAILGWIFYKAVGRLGVLQRRFGT